MTHNLNKNKMNNHKDKVAEAVEGDKMRFRVHQVFGRDGMPRQQVVSYLLDFHSQYRTMDEDGLRQRSQEIDRNVHLDTLRPHPLFWCKYGRLISITSLREERGTPDSMDLRNWSLRFCFKDRCEFFNVWQAIKELGTEIVAWYANYWCLPLAFKGWSWTACTLALPLPVDFKYSYEWEKWHADDDFLDWIIPNGREYVPEKG